MNKLVGTVFVLLFGVVCYSLGGVGEQNYDQPTRTITKTVVKEKTVLKEKEKRVYIQPDSCKEVFSLSQRVYKAVVKYEEILGRETKIQEEMYLARVEANQNQLNLIAEKQRKLKADTLDSALELQESNRDLKTSNEECRKYLLK